MFDHILVPLEGKPHDSVVTSIADRLAGRWGAQVEVVSVLAQGEDTGEREAAIARELTSFEEQPELTVRYVTYTVAESIAEEFSENPNTLIVMGTAARSRSEVVLDSVAEEVLDATDAPALLVGPDATIDDEWPSGNLFVCTDGSDESEVIVEDAAKWAGELDLHPFVVMAVDPEDVAAAGGDVTESGHVRKVARQIGSITGSAADFDVVHGDDPAESLVRYMGDHDAGLIAVATSGREGWSRLVHGSVAMSIVHDASCPVLVRMET